MGGGKGGWGKGRLREGLLPKECQGGWRRGWAVGERGVE
jgi:hypothetical protein